MTIEIKVPAMGESVSEATVGRWFKGEGDSVSRDEPLLELETDKVTVEVPAPADGALQSIAVKTGETVQVGTVLGAISEGASAKVSPPKQSAAPAPELPAAPKPAPPSDAGGTPAALGRAYAPAPAAAPDALMPSVKRIAEESG